MGHIWSYMHHIWSYMNLSDHIWSIYDHIWTIYEHTWTKICLYMGHIWSYMGGMGQRMGWACGWHKKCSTTLLQKFLMLDVRFNFPWNYDRTFSLFQWLLHQRVRKRCLKPGKTEWSTAPLGKSALQNLETQTVAPSVVISQIRIIIYTEIQAGPGAQIMARNNEQARIRGIKPASEWSMERGSGQWIMPGGAWPAKTFKKVKGWRAWMRKRDRGSEKVTSD